MLNRLILPPYLPALLLTGWFLVDASPLSAQTLRIYHSDVEQADAALVVMPNGRTPLIDAGRTGTVRASAT